MNVQLFKPLIARPGWIVWPIRVQRGSESELFSGAQYGGAAIFDYHIAGSAMTFPRCRYYYLTTYAGPARIGRTPASG